MQEDQEKLDKTKEREAALLLNVREAYLVFPEKDYLLGKLISSELQDIVRYLCCAEKQGTGEGDTHSNHNQNKTKLKVSISTVT